MGIDLMKTILVFVVVVAVAVNGTSDVGTEFDGGLSNPEESEGQNAMAKLTKVANPNKLAQMTSKTAGHGNDQLSKATSRFSNVANGAVDVTDHVKGATGQVTGLFGLANIPAVDQTTGNGQQQPDVQTLDADYNSQSKNKETPKTTTEHCVKPDDQSLNCPTQLDIKELKKKQKTAETTTGQPETSTTASESDSEPEQETNSDFGRSQSNQQLRSELKRRLIKSRLRAKQRRQQIEEEAAKAKRQQPITKHNQKLSPELQQLLMASNSEAEKTQQEKTNPAEVLLTENRSQQEDPEDEEAERDASEAESEDGPIEELLTT